jgi:hypothetical protein
MSELRIYLTENRASFQPGEELTGSASWQLDKPARGLELRLFWFTRGRGTEDASVVQTVRFDQPLNTETRSFRFRLPEAPYSCSGKLISLVWALELIVEPSREVSRRELIVAPRGQEVQLGTVDAQLGKVASSITWQA